MTDTQWGPPLTGEQMKALRAARLPDDVHVAWGLIVRPAKFWDYSGIDYRLPADHVAYTLLKAGWLDIPNVRLWFGGDKAPDDWNGRGVLLSDGREGYGNRWKHINARDIIAYIAKAEDAIMDHLDSLLPPEDTVTIAKMTEAEASARLQKFHPLGQVAAFEALKELGLIKPTRAERFWQGKERNSLYGDETARALIVEALEFER